MEYPVCLIENHDDGTIQVNQEALNILSRFTQKVVVVGIVGKYRTGKSYLMNKLAGHNNGFSLGSTIQSMTKGIWMWCVPHPAKRDHTLVLLDTEGLGDVEKGNSQNDSWIFALTVLLSSTLVFNSVGTIDQQAMDQLQYPFRDLNGKSTVLEVSGALNPPDTESSWLHLTDIHIVSPKDEYFNPPMTNCSRCYAGHAHTD
ncbi:unnamed protein product [Ranitomeya imitator]|uniref:GB1/RHD3-type G domain-containing protein n=1 Tax=Ranitomeya imitator TaxID=111125 RepID=A0ABN9LXD4_9NEOB|nr:unnamed protein product [Ranitomeya imitator]